MELNRRTTAMMMGMLMRMCNAPVSDVLFH